MAREVRRQGGPETEHCVVPSVRAATWRTVLKGARPTAGPRLPAGMLYSLPPNYVLPHGIEAGFLRATGEGPVTFIIDAEQAPD